MLDDLDYIARFDSNNALAVTAGQPEQLLYKDFEFKPSKISSIENVVLAGMGGSALAGQLVRSWWDDRLPIPFTITRDYKLPAFVSKNTLVIISSYSGNTEETISELKDAKQKGASIIVVTSNGQVQKLAEQNNYPLLKMPTGYQPRMAAWFNIKILAHIFEEFGWAKNALAELQAAHEPLTKAAVGYVPQVKTGDNQAKQIAQELAGKIIVVYGGSLLNSAAYKWKINFNENAKNLAFYNSLPEFSHNEFVGWSSHPIEKPLAVVELQSSFDNSQITKRFEVSNRLLSGKMPKPIEVEAKGKSTIEQILWTVLLGDFVSVYLAILNGVNPTPVELIAKLKKAL